MEKLYLVHKNKTWNWLRIQSWASYCKIQAYIEEIGKTTRLLKCDLNQIPYGYRVDMINRFKGLGVKKNYTKSLNDPDNRDGVVSHLETDILECEIK